VIVHEISLSPAVLEDQTAVTLESALRSRLQPFGETLENPKRHCDILNSDSAKALLRVGTERAAAVRIPAASGLRCSIHSSCMMHMFFAAICGMMKPLDMMSGMFCGTVLMHRSDNIAEVRKACYAWLDEHVTVTFEEPDDSIYNGFNQAVVDMLQWADEDTALRERVATADIDSWKAFGEGLKPVVTVVLICARAFV
jgi:hypothetical protein